MLRLRSPSFERAWRLRSPSLERGARTRHSPSVGRERTGEQRVEDFDVNAYLDLVASGAVTPLRASFVCELARKGKPLDRREALRTAVAGIA